MHKKVDIKFKKKNIYIDIFIYMYVNNNSEITIVQNR